QFTVESSLAAGQTPPDSNLGRDYIYICLAFITWPIAALILASVLGVVRNYARYLIAYNWMSVPAMGLGLVPHLLHLSGVLGWQGMALPSLAVFIGLAYLSWYVALRGFETTPLIAFAFVPAEYALSFGLDAIVR